MNSIFDPVGAQPTCESTSGIAAAPQRETEVGSELNRIDRNIMKVAERLAELFTRLQTVTAPDRPSNNKKDSQPCSPAPSTPLASRLREDAIKLDQIRLGIESVIGRLEL